MIRDLYIKANAAGGASISTATLMKTGQTTSYRTGDDGDFEAGRATDFLTLAENNPFGNTNRFTDELGGSTYTNNIVIDWSTFNGSTVLGYYRTFLANANWDGQIDACLALSIGGFGSWRLWNIYEAMNICRWNGATYFNYAPINITSFGGFCHTSTSRDASFCQKVLYTGTAVYFDLDAKANAAKGVAVRTFTVTGTILS